MVGVNSCGMRAVSTYFWACCSSSASRPAMTEPAWLRPWAGGGQLRNANLQVAGLSQQGRHTVVDGGALLLDFRVAGGHRLWYAWHRAEGL